MMLHAHPKDKGLQRTKLKQLSLVETSERSPHSYSTNGLVEAGKEHSTLIMNGDTHGNKEQPEQRSADIDHRPVSENMFSFLIV